MTSAELEDDATIEVELSFDKATTPSLPVDANDFFNSLLARFPHRLTTLSMLAQH